MEQTVQITINLPLSEAQKLLAYAKENNTSVDEMVSDLIERPAGAFNEMRDQITALECMVGALSHDLFNPKRQPYITRPLDLESLNIKEMTPDSVLPFLRLDDEGQHRFLKHYAQKHDPLINDGTVIVSALTGRTIESIHIIGDDIDRPVGIGIAMTDDCEIDILAVKKKYDPSQGFLGGLKKEYSAQMLWHVFKGP